MTDPDLLARQRASFSALLEAEGDEGHEAHPFVTEVLTLNDLGWSQVLWVGGDLALSSVDALMLIQLTPEDELVNTLYEQSAMSEHDWVTRLLGIAEAQGRPADNKRFSIVAWRDRTHAWHLPRRW
jgi:hypothetical protein